MLTMLGIIIGVASVVALMAIGNGAKQDVLDRIQAMGTDLLTIVRRINRGSRLGWRRDQFPARRLAIHRQCAGCRHGCSLKQTSPP